MNPSPGGIDPDWFEHAFGDWYRIIYAHRSIEAARPEALFAAQTLQVTSGDRLLDLCCGTGRHLLHLSAISERSIGLDYSRTLLREAQRHLGSRSRLVRADMRAIPFVGTLDVIVNFFTSFGYFADPADDVRVIQCLASALKPSGRFLIDCMNPSYLVQSLERESFRESEGYEIRETRWIDEEGLRVNKTTEIRQGGRIVRRLSESVRLYSKEELTGMVRDAGLKVQHVFGDFLGAPFQASSERMIVAGQKCR
ncbi:MAG: methyltransferase [Candidatus Hydrogenedentota bacterium]